MGDVCEGKTEAVLLLAPRHLIFAGGQVFADEGHGGQVLAGRRQELVQGVAKQVRAGIGNAQQVIWLKRVGDKPLRTAQVALARIFGVIFLRDELPAGHSPVVFCLLLEEAKNVARRVRHHEFAHESAAGGADIVLYVCARSVIQFICRTSDAEESSIRHRC